MLLVLLLWLRAALIGTVADRGQPTCGLGCGCVVAAQCEHTQLQDQMVDTGCDCHHAVRSQVWRSGHEYAQAFSRGVPLGSMTTTPLPKEAKATRGTQVR